MSAEQLIPRKNIEGKKIPFMPRHIGQEQHFESPFPRVDLSQIPHILKPKHDVKRAQEAWRRKNEPEWKRKEGLAGFARINDFLKELPAKQQEAIAAIFPESGGHKSVKETAEELHKSVPAIRSAFNLGMKQLKSKETTGKFLKQGRRRRPVEDSSSRGNQSPVLTRREKERKIVEEAIKTGTFLQLHRSQQEVLTMKCLGKGLLEKNLDRRLVSARKRAGLEHLLDLENGRPILKGRPRKPGARRSFADDPYLKKSKAVRIERQMGKPRKQVDASELRLLVNQGENTNQIAKNLHSSWQTIVRMANDYGIQLPKLKRGQPKKLHVASS